MKKPDAWGLLKELLFKPSGYFRRIKKGQGNLNFSVTLYAFSILAGSLFYYFKPQNFPRESFTSDMGGHSLVFWFLAGAIGFVLTTGICCCVWLLIRFLERRFVIKLQNIFIIVFSSHIYYLLLVVFLSAACFFQAETAYKTFEVIFALAGFIFTLAGIRLVSGSTLGRVFLSIFVASLLGAATLYGVYLAGILPVELLKALLFS